MGIPIPTIVEKIAEKKMIVMMTFYFIFQQIQNSLLTTGGLSIIIDNKLAYNTEGGIGAIDIDIILNSLN